MSPLSTSTEVRMMASPSRYLTPAVPVVHSVVSSARVYPGAPNQFHPIESRPTLVRGGDS